MNCLNLRTFIADRLREMQEKGGKDTEMSYMVLFYLKQLRRQVCPGSRGRGGGAPGPEEHVDGGGVAWARRVEEPRCAGRAVPLQEAGVAGRGGGGGRRIGRVGEGRGRAGDLGGDARHAQPGRQYK